MTLSIRGAVRTATATTTKNLVRSYLAIACEGVQRHAFPLANNESG
jgi:hypothetical protein